MPDPGAPSEPGSAELTIELAVDSGMTKTVYHLKERGLLTFKNRSHDQPLTIRSSAAKPPFVVSGCSSAQSEFVIPKKSRLTVKISEEYCEHERFTYSAQIEGSSAEDPIVIIEKR